MGIWDAHCLVCGGPLFLYSAPNEEEEAELVSKYNRLKDAGIDWLEKLLLINNREEKVPDGEMLTDAGGEYLGGDTVYAISSSDFGDVEDGEYGIVMHKSCFECIKKHLHHEIRFADVAYHLDENDSILANQRHYPVAKKYFEQQASILEVDDKDEYIYSDPMGDSESPKKNRNLIIKAWKPLVKRFKAHKPRPSPADSATKYKRGTVRTGFDGGLWKVVKNKWKRIKKST